LIVEFLSEVKKQLIGRLADKTADVLLPRDDQGAAANAITDQQLQEIHRQLLEIAAIISRGQDAPTGRPEAECSPASTQRSVAVDEQLAAALSTARRNFLLVAAPASVE
jgi:hypothetical protein